MSLEDSLQEALQDPGMMQMLAQQAQQLQPRDVPGMMQDVEALRAPKRLRVLLRAGIPHADDNTSPAGPARARSRQRARSVKSNIQEI